MDAERSLLSKTIQTGELSEVVARGIELDHFADDECAEVYDFMLYHYRKHKACPSTAVVKGEFPSFKPTMSRDPLSYHIEQFVLKVKEREAVDLVRDFHEALEDPDEVAEIELVALEMARKLTDVVPAPRAMRFSEMHQRIREYDRRKEAGELHGIMLGIPTLDRETLGAQPHELVTFVAYQGVGKSKLLQHAAYSAYLQGKTALYVSLEMEAEAIFRSIDTMATNFKYHALKALELDVGDREDWLRLADKAHEDRHERDIYIIDRIPNCTADHVMAETFRYNPDVAIADYMELMKVPRGVVGSHWEKVQYTTQGLKQNARMLGVPILSAAQLSREGGKGEVTLATVSYQSVGKDSDILIGLSQDEEEESNQEMKLIPLKVRDGRKNFRVMLRWQLEEMRIHEKGAAERFPVRIGGKLQSGKHKTSATRRKQRRLEVVDNNRGKKNPWLERTRKPKVEVRTRAA